MWFLYFKIGLSGPTHIVSQECKNIWTYNNLSYNFFELEVCQLKTSLWLTSFFILMCLLGPSPILYGGIVLHYSVCIC